MVRAARNSLVRTSAELDSGSPQPRRLRRLARGLIADARDERIRAARDELMRDRGLEVSADAVDASDIVLDAASRAFAAYGDGGLVLPLRARQGCRLQDWKYAIVEVEEREADTDDDDGGGEPTSVNYASVKDVAATVLGHLDLINMETDGIPSVERAYVVEAEQKFHFFVRPLAKKESKAEKEKKKGVEDDQSKRGGASLFSFAKKSRDEKKTEDKPVEKAEAKARRHAKELRLKHSVGSRVVLGADVVKKTGRGSSSITGECWGTVLAIVATADGDRARIRWDSGTPEAEFGKDSFFLHARAAA